MFNNLKLSLGTLTVPPIPDPTSSELSMVPLVEPIRTLSTGTLEWPANIFGETPHTAMADEITALYQAARRRRLRHRPHGGRRIGQGDAVSAEGRRRRWNRGARLRGVDVRGAGDSQPGDRGGEDLRRRRRGHHPRRGRLGQHHLRNRAGADAGRLHRRRPGGDRPDRTGPAAGLAAELGPEHAPRRDRDGVDLDAGRMAGRPRSPGPGHLLRSQVPVPLLLRRRSPDRGRLRSAGREVRRGLLPRRRPR